jgi:DNA-binding CsgD family transcriptional regulator
MLIGREVERARIEELLEAASVSRSGALVLRGEPGIGKTALLEDARLRAADMHVLAARGLESESELPFAGLHQLLLPALRLLDDIPAPQALALKGALGLAERPGDDRFLISAACLSLLSELAEERPVLCLVDDANWLDTPSADALLFVARRLGAEGIAMLFTAREGETRRFDARDLPELELGELDSASSSSLLARQITGELDDWVRERLLERARGNALALVELPSALSADQLAGLEPLPDALPITRDLERLFLDRVRQLPDRTQQLLVIVAADTSRDLATIIRAAESLGIGPETLGPAEVAGVVVVRGSRIDLRHSLVRSAIYQGASTTERRAAHLALAEAVGEQEADQQAWHRAAAAFGLDASVAEELERTAERARLRSGHAAAASALERAADLSVDSDLKGRRLVAAASAAWHAGQPDRATALVDRASPLVSDAGLRGELNHVRGQIEWRCGAIPNACAILLEGAADVAPLDTHKTLEILFDAGMAAADAGDYARIAEVGRIAELLQRGDAVEDAFLADMLVGAGRLIAGDNAGAPFVMDAIARVQDLDDPQLLAWAGVWAPRAGESALEAPTLRRAANLARATGAVDTLTFVLEAVAIQGFVAGQYSVLAEATEGLELAREAGLANAATHHRASLAWIHAVKGHEDECRAHALEVIEDARTSGHALANSVAHWGLALLDLSLGRPEDAARRLHELRRAAPGAAHPYFVRMSTPDLVEASVRAGNPEDAREALPALEPFREPGAPTWAMALVARCRALLAAGEEAEAEYREALRLHDESTRPFDRARTQLLYGEHLRRNRRRVDSRDHLRSAVETFEALGAELWTERARAELRASGESARKRDPSTVDELTPQELQIARFVAEGMSNKEVAAQLFLSPRTIDYHLRHVFSKLGITSRTQLARLPLGEPNTAVLATSS